MSDLGPRYLAAFHPKRLPHHFVDVLIVGGGLAGLRAAIEIDQSLNVLVVTKDQLRQSNSSYAQGGIAGVFDPEDRFEDHISDTLTAGHGLCDTEVVEMVVREAPQRIQELIDWGTHFDLNHGELALGREGGHSRHRIVHAQGDATGREVMRAVIDWTERLSHVTTWENSFTLDLLCDDEGCRGAIVARAGGEMNLVWARQTILCTGGAGQLYRESSNPEVATGDGIALAWRAGAELRDMEFMQFHPTMLYIAGSSRILVTEAVRGEGAHLVDNSGTRFMGDYDPRLELAPRDVVSRAIVLQMERTRHSCVYLDMTHLEPNYVRRRFPGLLQSCAKFGLDITTDRIPVRPGAHYFVGGVSVDHEGRTTVPNLWGAGEVTASGLHGANRLASNSLLEGMVYGAHAGRGASDAALAMPDELRAMPIENPRQPVATRPTGETKATDSDPFAGVDAAEQSARAATVATGSGGVTEPGEPLDLADIRNALKSLMWRRVGVRRDRAGLLSAAETIDAWCRYVLPRQFDNQEGWELQNMLTVARIMTRAALLREETRGVHQRTDFPNTDDEHWRRHLSFIRREPAGRPVEVDA
ncbi:MAG: L-aspartate oxidase [Planctomycetia bacterium]|nr:L-aspartate oxidase [Planctomycetia bacterium]